MKEIFKKPDSAELHFQSIGHFYFKIMSTKNSKPSSEFEEKDRCPSCGNYCNIFTDLDENDNCNDCRE